MNEANEYPESPTAGSQPKSGRVAYGVISIVSVVLLTGLCGVGLWHLQSAALSALLSEHTPALIGMPVAVLIAIILVSGARVIDGHLDFSILGIGVKGACAVLLAWLAIFTSIVLAIRALW